MRRAADPQRIRDLARELGKTVTPGTKMYLTGGATAVLEGWRGSTVDVDVRFEPDSDAALARISELEEKLSVNVELASPLDLSAGPQRLAGSVTLSLPEGKRGGLRLRPLLTSSLSKLERGFELDLEDVANMVSSGQVEPQKLLELFEGIESELFRFPAVDPARLRASVESLAHE